MFENLLDLVKQHAGDAIVNNPAIPNEKNNDAINTATSSITGGLQKLLSGGGLGDILKMFSGGDGNNNIHNSQAVKNISGGFIQNLMDKFGLDHEAAKGVSDKVIPNVMNDLVRKTNDPHDKSFDIQGIFNSLSGGKTSGMDVQGLLNKVKGGGLDMDGDGDTDLSDLKSALSGNSSGIIGKIKGLFS